MTVLQMAEALGLEVVAGQKGVAREFTSVYTCDLLSFVMGRAPADSAWVTVMGNINAIAVASLADVACIVLADGATIDAAGQQKAEEEGIPVLYSQAPIFETGKQIDGLL